jgi:DNA segregation ATPase FtsK/SpoIIIE-like protein
MEFQPWAACLDRLATTPAEAGALLADVVTILYARAQHLADLGRREWQPSQRMPALVIIIDEYAELAEQAPAALKHTDTIARLGRAPAVTLVLATQRPTQNVMGHSAVRSQMNIRISFRVEEQRDADLILGRGKLKAGWHAHKLNAPGKFLLWSPEHGTPRRARAYLLTDADVTATAAHYAAARPPLDPISRAALTPPSAAPPNQTELGGPGQDQNAGDGTGDPEAKLWATLSGAAKPGLSVADLMAATGMGRRWVYYRLGKLSAAGHVIQTTRGRWRTAPQGGNHE